MNLIHPFVKGPSGGRIIICTGDDLQPRDECPNALHDDPMPAGYNASFEEANRRLNRGRRNKRCPECGRYGWTP